MTRRDVRGSTWFANAVAAQATTRLGAQAALPRAEEVHALLARVRLASTGPVS